MTACEWCWARAFVRAHCDLSQSQGEHYRDILNEQERMGRDAECPNVRAAVDAVPQAPEGA